MDLIDNLFAVVSEGIKTFFPAGALTDLVADGIIPGIGGVAIFIPQIALLFGFLAILEDSGYMSRVVFLTDRLMKPFGLNGKSIVPHDFRTGMCYSSCYGSPEYRKLQRPFNYDFSYPADELFSQASRLRYFDWACNSG